MPQTYLLTHQDLIRLCYNVFMYTTTVKNPDDGGPVDWMNDTKPQTEIWIKEITKTA